MTNPKIIIRGEKHLTNISSSTDYLQLVDSFTVGIAVRGVSERCEVELHDDSIVELVFEDTTTWLCDQITIKEKPASMKIILTEDK